MMIVLIPWLISLLRFRICSECVKIFICYDIKWDQRDTILESISWWTSWDNKFFHLFVHELLNYLSIFLVSILIWTQLILWKLYPRFKYSSKNLCMIVCLDELGTLTNIAWRIAVQILILMLKYMPIEIFHLDCLS